MELVESQAVILPCNINFNVKKKKIWPSEDPKAAVEKASCSFHDSLQVFVPKF